MSVTSFFSYKGRIISDSHTHTPHTHTHTHTMFTPVVRVCTAYTAVRAGLPQSQPAGSATYRAPRVIVPLNTDEEAGTRMTGSLAVSAAAVTWGWSGHRSNSEHRKLFLEKKNLPSVAPLAGIEPPTFRLPGSPAAALPVPVRKYPGHRPTVHVYNT